MRSNTILAIALAAAASVASAAARPDPADPHAVPVQLRFRTGLDVAARDADVDPAARWREHNERVRAIGGHAGYLRGGKSDPAATPDAIGKEQKR